jgi:hypothetical protein
MGNYLVRPLPLRPHQHFVLRDIIPLQSRHRIDLMIFLFLDSQVYDSRPAFCSCAELISKQLERELAAV